MIFGVKSESYFTSADMQQFILVVFCATELTDNLAKWVVLRRAEVWKVVNDEVVDGKNVGELDVECRFGSCKEVVELVNLELGLSRADIDHVRPDVLQAVNSFGNVAVEWLEIEIITTE